MKVRLILNRVEWATQLQSALSTVSYAAEVTITLQLWREYTAAHSMTKRLKIVAFQNKLSRHFLTTFAAFNSSAIKRCCVSSGVGLQDGLSRWLSWSGVQHHETVLEPGSCCSTKLSDVEGVAPTYHPRHRKKTVMETEQWQTWQVPFVSGWLFGCLDHNLRW